MKKSITVKLVLLLLFSCFSVTAQKLDFAHKNHFSDLQIEKKDSAKYKKSVAIVITPQYKELREGYGKHSTVYYIASVQFPVDGKEINGATNNSFLYYSAQTGDCFTVLYDKMNPQEFVVVNNAPQLDPSCDIDTTAGTVKTIYSFGSDLIFSYTVNNTKFTKTQQMLPDENLYNVRPDIFASRKFKMIYDAGEPQKAILLMNQPLDTASYSFKPHTNLLGISALPLTKFSLIYSRIAWKRFAVGVTGSVYYDPLHESSFLARGGRKPGPRDYTNTYYAFKNAYSISPNIKWYVRNPAPLGVFLKVQCSFLTTQVKSDYFNKGGLPSDTTALALAMMDPVNKAFTKFTTVNAFGLQSGAGVDFFLGNYYKWVMEINGGFQYYFYPDHLKQSILMAGTTYYWHDSPGWDKFFNFPLYFEFNIYRKF